MIKFLLITTGMIIGTVLALYISTWALMIYWALSWTT